MPGFIYIPRQRTTWDQLFPLAMQMLYRKSAAAEEAKRQKELLSQKEEFASSEAEKQRQFQQELENRRIQGQLMGKGYRPVELGTGQEYAATYEEPAFKFAGKGWRPPEEAKFGKVEPIKLEGKTIAAGFPILKGNRVVDYKIQTIPQVKLNTKDFTDAQGNVTRLISDPTSGEILKEVRLGKIAKGTVPKQGTLPEVQKNYNLFRQQNPDYKGTIMDFYKAWKAKDPDEVALGLAAKDWQVLAGKKSLADAAQEYRDAWTRLKQGGTQPSREQAIQILKENNYPVTERNIQAILQQLGQ